MTIIRNNRNKKNKNKFLYNNIDMLKNMFKIKLQSNKKIPAQKWKDRALWSKKRTTRNYAIMTGPENNLLVVDIDYKLKPDDFFFKFLKKTFTVETRKGFHLYYKYTTDLFEGKNTVGNIEGIDTRGLSGYVVGPGSQYKNSQYLIYNNSQITSIPQEMIDYFNEHSTHKQKSRQYNKKMKKYIHIKDNTKIDYKFMIPDIDYYIRNNLPECYITNFKKWFKFTSFMKVIDNIDLWHEMSKRSDKYDYNKNMEMWNSLDSKYYGIINFMLNEMKYKNFDVNNVKYKPNEQLIKNPFIVDYEIKQEKLDSDFINEVIKQKKVTVIKSDTGTGKSTCMKKYINDNNVTYFSLVSRKSLLREQANTFPYVQVCSDIHEPKFRGAKNIISTIEKAMKYIGHEVIIKPDPTNLFGEKIEHSFNYVKGCTLILDEFDSFLKHLMNSPTVRNRINVWKWLIELINSVDKVICLDADISEISLYYLSKIVGQQNITYINNLYKHNNNVNVNIENVYNDFVESIKKQEKFMVCCDSLKECENLKKKLGLKNIKLFTSNTNNEDVDLDKYDKVIFSPTIIYGLDSSMERPVYALYTGNTIESSSMVQQIARNRNITNLTIHFINKKYSEPKYNSVSECREELILSKEWIIQEFGVLNCDSSLFFDIYALMNYKLDIIGTNKYVHLIKILKSRGCSINFNGFGQTSVKDNKFETLQQEIERAKENLDLTTESKILLLEDLNISEDQYIENIELLRDTKNINYHYNIKSYFIYDELKIKNEDDFIISYMHSNNFKLNFLKKLKQNIIIKNDTIQLSDSLNPIFSDMIPLDTVIKQISQIKTKLNKDNYIKIFVKLNKLFFGKEIINSKQLRINGKRQYIYSYNNEYIDKHKNLYFLGHPPYDEVEDFCDSDSEEEIFEINDL